MSIIRNDIYRGNVNLKKISTPVEWTPELMEEYVKCKDDVVYFAENYIKVITLDEGFTSINLYDYQKEIIKSFNDNSHTIVATSRQSGKCETYETLINTKNTKTGEVRSISIGELYEIEKAKKLPTLPKRI